MKKSLFMFSMLWSLGLTACGAESLEGADAAVEGGEAEGAVAGVLPPERCERLQIKLTPQGFSNSTIVDVPGPYTARISADGKKISCTGPTSDFIASRFLEDFFANFIVRFMPNDDHTALLFRDPLGPQRTTLRYTPAMSGTVTHDWKDPIKILRCHAHTATISAPGFAEQRMEVVAELNGTPTQSGTVFTTGCRLRVKGPITISRDKPPEITGTSGDRFIYAPPPFCDGDDCQPRACEPANQCSVSSDCGSPGRRECSQGCCVTIIR